MVLIGFAPRRHLAHDRHVEVAVGRERERPRDGRGGHDQDVRVHALGAQRRALHDAEAVLFVDHCQAELAKADGILDERVRADDEVQRAAGHLGLHLTPLFRRRRAGEQGHAEPGGLEEPPDIDVVLLGENLGRRHERYLEAVLHGDERRHQRDDGLAGTDVALQQPVHRMRALHVADDLADDLLLVAGQLERQHAARRFADLVGDDDGAGLHLGAGPPLSQHQAALEEEELLEDQAALRRRTK